MIDPVTISAFASGKVLQTISDIFNLAKRANSNIKDSSLIELTSSARVEPATIVGADCIYYENLPDVLQSLQSLFSGYYLQAVSLISQVGDVKVIRVLDKLNPTRSSALGFSGENHKDNWRLAAESYKYRLPTTSNKPAMEAEKESASSKLGNLKDSVSITDLANLSVGKLVNVTLKSPDGKNTLTVPISIRLMVSQISEVSINHLLSMATTDTDIVERYHAWRSGRISFIKDLILCQDLIAEHRKALMKDKDGTYSQIIARVNNNKRAGFITDNPSLAVASNLFVISEASKAAIEDKMGGKLSNYRIRQRIFESSYIMILVVIDRQWDRVTFYHRGIEASTEVGIRDIKAGNKGSGPDIADILKAYSIGNSPSL